MRLSQESSPCLIEMVDYRSDPCLSGASSAPASSSSGFDLASRASDFGSEFEEVSAFESNLEGDYLFDNEDARAERCRITRKQIGY
jgi:hypothetical protein